MKFKSEAIKLLLIGLVFVSITGCGGSSTQEKCKVQSKTLKQVFNKEYYKCIDYSNIDALSDKFISRDSRFVDFKTQIKLPVISISVWGKKYEITSLTPTTSDEGVEVLFYESDKFKFTRYEVEEFVYITFDDKKDNREQMAVAYNFLGTSEIKATPTNGGRSIKYASDEMTVIFPKDVIANGNAIVEYDKKSSFALIRDGSLGTDVFNKLVDITQNYPNIKEIRLKNIAGSLNDEINMQTGLLLRKAKLNTYVVDTASNGTDIASGGVDLFTAGVKRRIENKQSVKLGIHSWSGTDSKGKKIEGKDYPKEDKLHHDQLLYFCAMLGVDKGYDFYFHTLNAASADNIHPMSAKELATYNILN